jgi:hypothetical protein
LRQFRNVVRGLAEINVADFKKFLVLKVGELVRVSALLVLETEEGILFKPEGRDYCAFLVRLQLQGQPKGNRDLVVCPERTDFALGFTAGTERR